MKNNYKELKQKAIQLKTEGLSSRKIANLLRVSKSVVNNWYSEYIAITPKTNKKPRILLLDLEVAPTIAATFGRWKQNIGQANVIFEGGWILTAAYKWLNEPTVYALSEPSEIAEKSDRFICEELFKLYEEADVVISHNAQGFDHKVLQTRCVLNGLPPLPTVKVLDTLQMAKKNFKFNSNRLDSLAQYFGYEGKIDTGGMKLWLDVMNGDPEALNKMLEYNAHDVILLEKVYNHIKAWGHSGSNYNAGNHYDDGKLHCNICGSTDVTETGRNTHTQVSKFKEVRCNDCGAVSRTRQSLTTKEKRSTILVPS